MRTSVTWINDYLDRPADAEEQARLLTAAGLNYDGGETTDEGELWQEIETTSNRGDCLCHVGMAREICAMSDRSLRFPSADVPTRQGTKPSAPSASPASSFIRVFNEDHEGCPRYSARVIRGVRVGPSPEWMQRRLRAIGQIPRNNLVDCSNFVLFELGQPTHVFDLDKLQGGELRVRHARAGERLRPIGEGAAEVTLRAGDLVIADARDPVAIAGVKGGAPTAVSETTVNIVLESAAFSPAAVRRASRGLRISSDSSYRFERGVHPAEIDVPAERLAELILETAGGELCSGVLYAGAPLPPPRTVELRQARLNALLGIDIPTPTVRRILETLGFAPTLRGTGQEAVFACTIPHRRLDIEREVDLIEEVCRIHGLDHIPLLEKIQVRVAPLQSAVAAPRAVKELLTGMECLETITHTLISQRHAEPFLPAGATLLHVTDERAGGAPILRPSVLPSLLEVKRRNADNGMPHLRLFEAAHAFHGHQGSPCERTVVGLLNDQPREEPLRWLRGACERTLQLLAGRHAHITVTPLEGTARLPAFRVQARLAVGGVPAGTLGVLSPATCELFGLEGPLAAAELEIEHLYEGFPPDARAEALPAFPGITRDLSVIVEEALPWARIQEVVDGLKLPLFQGLEFVGTYRGKQTGAGRKSVTMRLHFRAPDRTLRREEADEAMTTLAGALTSTLGADIRA